jgi:hypothetical protein
MQMAIVFCDDECDCFGEEQFFGNGDRFLGMRRGDAEGTA